ncbi:putative membrane protein [Campylobacter blaseri]|nr:molybdate transport repressor [Campylobacter blaseri]QKF86776.1 putative membrane protein [Campylobacter blaseri]
MIIKEDKKSLIATLFAIILLFIASLAGYFYYDVKGAAIFSMAVSFVCIYFCLNKALKESYINIQDDGFLIKKGKKEIKIYFKYISSIDTKIVDTKKNSKIIVIKFRKRKIDMELVEGLLQRLGDDEATILTKYEKPTDEIYNILKSSLHTFKNNS